jgi:hypothetical protein
MNRPGCVPIELAFYKNRSRLNLAQGHCLLMPALKHRFSKLFSICNSHTDRLYCGNKYTPGRAMTLCSKVYLLLILSGQRELAGNFCLFWILWDSEFYGTIHPCSKERGGWQIMNCPKASSWRWNIFLTDPNFKHNREINPAMNPERWELESPRGA